MGAKKGKREWWKKKGKVKREVKSMQGNKQFYVKKSTNKLKIKNMSSSLSNFRSLEEKSSHFPLDLWDEVGV